MAASRDLSSIILAYTAGWWLCKLHVYAFSMADAYLVRMKKQEAARAARAVMKLRRPAPVYRQKSMPPTSTATADPPEKAAEICDLGD